jgi:hypothetical protein
MEAMTREELAPAGPRETKEVLEVWRRSSERPGHRGIERSADRGEEQDRCDARADLEAAVGAGAVRHPIADVVEEQSQWQRAEPRTDERAAGSTGRNVKGDDQAPSLASRCRPSAHLRQPDLARRASRSPRCGRRATSGGSRALLCDAPARPLRRSAGLLDIDRPAHGDAPSTARPDYLCSTAATASASVR